MPTKKRILLGGVAGLCVLLAALLTLPILFSGRIEEAIRAGIEDATELDVSWAAARLGLLRSFPHPSLSLEGLTVARAEESAGDTLATVESLRVALDGASVWRTIRGGGPLVVRSVRIDRPVVRLVRTTDGSEDETDELSPDEGGAAGSTGAGDGRALSVSLRSLELADGEVLIDDARSGLFVSLAGLDHALSGDFSRDALTARTATSADAVTVRFAGTPYLSETRLGLDADFDVDPSAGRVRLTDNELRLNDLVVRLAGEVARAAQGAAGGTGMGAGSAAAGPAALRLDLTFEAPNTEFGQLLSLVPQVYAQDFASLETAGSFSMSGHVQGVYGPEDFPALALDLVVRDGRFRYPDLPLPAEAISAELAISNPGGDPDSTVVALRSFHVEIDGQPFDASALLRTPISDPDADVTVAGSIDLEALSRTVKLERAEGVSGVLTADARVRARRSDVEAQQYDRIVARGDVAATELVLPPTATKQPVVVHDAALSLTPQTAELSRFDATLGSSDVRASGRLDNVLGFAFGVEPLRGTARFDSNRLVLDEWKSEEAASAIPVPADIDLTLDGTVGTLVLNGLEMTEASGRGVVRDERLTLDAFRVNALGGRIGVDGFYDTVDPQRPTFAVDLALDSLDIAGAAEAFLTVRSLAPVASYARGAFSSTLNLSGALGSDLAPALDVLDGDGTLTTSRIAIEGFPLLARLSERLELDRLSSPTIDAIRSSIHIREGRLVVDPFGASVAGLGMTVSGSTGIDRSIAYDLAVQLPRSGLAQSTLSSLASRAGPLGAGLAAADPVTVGVGVTGSVTEPALSLGLRETTSSMTSASRQAAQDAVGMQLDDARAEADAATEEARRVARERADSIIAEANRQAERIRTEGKRAADVVRSEGAQAADDVLARATSPIARAAAEPVAARLRQEAETRAAGIEAEAEQRATMLETEARARADAILEGVGGGP